MKPRVTFVLALAATCLSAGNLLAQYSDLIAVDEGRSDGAWSSMMAPNGLVPTPGFVVLKENSNPMIPANNGINPERNWSDLLYFPNPLSDPILQRDPTYTPGKFYIMSDSDTPPGGITSSQLAMLGLTPAQIYNSPQTITYQESTTLAYTDVYRPGDICPGYRVYSDPATSTGYNESFLAKNGQTSLNIVLKGDQQNLVTADTWTNWGPLTAITYSSMLDQTTVTFSGPAIVIDPDGSRPTIHVGFRLVEGAPALGWDWPSPLAVGKYWSDGTTATPVPAITFSVRASATDLVPMRWLALYAKATSASGGDPVYEWAEFPVPDSGSVQVLVQNGDGSNPRLVLTDVGYMLSDTEIPLGDLNDQVLPASSFTPLGVPNGGGLDQGQSLVLTVATPEPSTFVLLGAAAAVFLAFARHRRNPPRHASC